ncbi:FAD-dependent monooxygenase [Blochmannia endosymbiont of Colobopsis nipponica]|uniref:FAD-dependent monooxygenase n=1 Tax=Blochmannia endosymbiont of Colobopsis nipponica TaxID=2681987 RepID=UPI0017805454|nr:FAD-dependent monooxygenase [Blochmannia endosymbiont of Colobopsis nipponica]QOI11123.1 FAD-dependent monooxygenase [Blochmannia endosymbiont of Colobopsis nipponica]
MNKFKSFYDIIISGGGVIGSSLALCLVQAGFRVILIEKKFQNFQIPDKNKLDFRALAINYSSINFLAKIRVWQSINVSYCVPYEQLETWENYSSKVIFNSRSINIPEMGYIIEYKYLQSTIWQNFNRYSLLKLYYPATIFSIEYYGNYWRLRLNDGSLVFGHLLVGADGINSIIRRLSGISVSGWKYRQSCMLLNAKVEKCQSNTIWQIFTPSGPKGCLPLRNNRVSLMWYDNNFRIYQFQKLSLLSLEKEIQGFFIKKLGKIRLHDVKFFPLLSHHAHSYICPGLALVGDAAHCIHPLAGQGVNLGFRDIESLAKILIDSRCKRELWYNIEVLLSYQQNRRCDNFLMQFSVNLFYLIFSNENYFLKIMRNFGFSFLNNLPFLKKKILKYALGIFN